MPEVKNPRSPEPRLDVPGDRRRSLLPNWDADSFGRFAEDFARFMGTGKFLGWMTVFIIVWVGGNIAAYQTWGNALDPFPFILLNLVFSTQASYAAPLILLAQNRQEARDRISLEEDRRVAAQSRADMDFLAREVASLRQSVGDLATRDYIRSELRAELRSLLAELDGEEPPKKSRKKRQD